MKPAESSSLKLKHWLLPSWPIVAENCSPVSRAIFRYINAWAFANMGCFRFGYF